MITMSTRIGETAGGRRGRSGAMSSTLIAICIVRIRIRSRIVSIIIRSMSAMCRSRMFIIHNSRSTHISSCISADITTSISVMSISTSTSTSTRTRTSTSTSAGIRISISISIMVSLSLSISTRITIVLLYVFV